MAVDQATKRQSFGCRGSQNGSKVPQTSAPSGRLRSLTPERGTTFVSCARFPSLPSSCTMGAPLASKRVKTVA
jgi:hypothetical protein